MQPPASVAVIVAENVPVAVGVPVTCPFAELMPRPAGSPVADHVIVEVVPLCEKVAVAIAVL